MFLISLFLCIINLIEILIYIYFDSFVRIVFGTLRLNLYACCFNKILYTILLQPMFNIYKYCFAQKREYTIEYIYF